MRVFLSEYCTCGTDPAAAAGPLSAEGAAMLRALAADAAKVDGVEVVVAWSAGLEPFGVPGVEVVPVSPSPTGAAFDALFPHLAADCDATLHVAPETDDVLARRAETILDAGHVWLGCWPDAIRLCGDKLRLAEELSRAGVRTPNTIPFSPAAAAEMLDRSRRRHFPPGRPVGGGIVIKPRFGAGCDITYRVAAPEQLPHALRAVESSGYPGGFVIQPAVLGSSSEVLLIAPSGVTRFPFTMQNVRAARADGRLTYNGGELWIGHDEPDGFVWRDAEQTDDAAPAAAAVRAVPGLEGWVGVDGDFSVLDVNPRLTTSYLVYRASTRDNLAERLLFPNEKHAPVVWEQGERSFTKDGRVTVDWLPSDDEDS